MKAEKVIIKNDDKTKTEPMCEWNPKVENLPNIVKKYLDQWLSPDQLRRHKKAIVRALVEMVNDGQMRERTIILQLSGEHKGEIVQKEFTFFKSVSERIAR